MTASVLVVEDDQATRDVLHVLLEDAGYTTSEAADGIAALEVLRASETPLITILDLDLPHVDGLTVLSAVAAEPTLAARHRFIVLTAVSRERIRQTDEVRTKLSVPVVLKPFDVDVLLRVVANARGPIPPQPLPGTGGADVQGSNRE